MLSISEPQFPQMYRAEWTRWHIKALPAGLFKVYDSKQREESGSWRGSEPGAPQTTHKSPLRKRSRLCLRKSGQGHPVTSHNQECLGGCERHFTCAHVPSLHRLLPQAPTRQGLELPAGLQGWPTCSRTSVGTGSQEAPYHRDTAFPDVTVTPWGCTRNPGTPVGGPGAAFRNILLFQYIQMMHSHLDYKI